MLLHNYKLNDDIHLQIIKYLNFQDLFYYIRLNKKFYKIFLNCKHDIIFNYILAQDYHITKCANHISISKPQKVICVENNIIFDEKLLSIL